MARDRVQTVTAACLDCAWQDGARGCMGRAAQHHDRTGHEVTVVTAIVYRRVPMPGSMSLFDQPPEGGT